MCVIPRVCPGELVNLGWVVDAIAGAGARCVKSRIVDDDTGGLVHALVGSMSVVIDKRLVRRCMAYRAVGRWSL